MRYWDTHEGLAVECCGHALVFAFDENGIESIAYNYVAGELSDDVGCGYERTDYVNDGLDDNGEIIEIGSVDVAVFTKDTMLGEMLCVAFSDSEDGQWYLAAQLVDYGSGWYVLNVIGNDPEIEDIFNIDNGVIAKRC